MYEIAKIVLVFTYFVATTNSGQISCVQCSATRDKFIVGSPPCSEFDWSDQYIVKCPNSTMCYKKSYTIPLLDGHIEGVEKGCTPQVQLHYYLNPERKWKSSLKVVETVYQEGCVKGEDKGRPGKPAEFCYCSSWLCNKSSSVREISVALHLAATTLCLLANIFIL